jgi:hypothetical protein
MWSIGSVNRCYYLAWSQNPDGFSSISTTSLYWTGQTRTVGLYIGHFPPCPYYSLLHKRENISSLYIYSLRLRACALAQMTKCKVSDRLVYFCQLMDEFRWRHHDLGLTPRCRVWVNANNGCHRQCKGPSTIYFDIYNLILLASILLIWDVRLLDLKFSMYMLYIYTISNYMHVCTDDVYN